MLVFNARSQDVTVVDAKAGTVLRTEPLGAEPEPAVVGRDGLVYLNVENTNELVVFDPSKMTVVRRQSLAPCRRPMALATDAGVAELRLEQVVRAHGLEARVHDRGLPTMALSTAVFMLSHTPRRGTPTSAWKARACERRTASRGSVSGRPCARRPGCWRAWCARPLAAGAGHRRRRTCNSSRTGRHPRARSSSARRPHAVARHPAPRASLAPGGSRGQARSAIGFARRSILRWQQDIQESKMNLDLDR